MNVVLIVFYTWNENDLAIIWRDDTCDLATSFLGDLDLARNFKIVTSTDLANPSGPFKNYVTGGRGCSKIVTKSNKGEGVLSNSDDTT